MYNINNNVINMHVSCIIYNIKIHVLFTYYSHGGRKTDTSALKE